MSNHDVHLCGESDSESAATHKGMKPLNEVASRPVTGVGWWSEELANHAPVRIALADGDDPRVVRAALALHEQGLVEPILVGDQCAVRQHAEERGSVWPGDVTVISPLDAASAMSELANPHGDGRGASRREDPMLLQGVSAATATALARRGEVDGVVAGAAEPSAAVLRAALRILGLAPGVRQLSSGVLMDLSGIPVVFGDCAVVPLPDEEGLADTAVACAETCERLLRSQARVALLSFSTKGSANTSSVKQVRRAVELIHERAPELEVDGEFQFDAAFVPEIGRRKAPESMVAGRANVYIFPNLESANIGCKIAEHVGGAQFVGSILQGLRIPCSDLSRGCRWEEVFSAAMLTATQYVLDIA